MHLKDVKGKIDFGILTIREDEFEAVLHHLPNDDGIVTGRRIYNIRRVDLPTGDFYRVAVIRCIEQGTNEALDAARDLLDELSPQWLLVVGIAGGVPSSEFTLGDVVISTRIHDFSVEAVLQDGEGKHSTEYALAGGPVHRTAAAFVANLNARKRELGEWHASIETERLQTKDWKFYGDDEWKEDLAKKLEHHTSRQEPRFIAGPIASSDRLIKDTEILKVWLKMTRQVIAIEMESAGVYRAAHGQQIPTLAIRGISDIVGLKREPQWTGYACESAAAFLAAFLQLAPVEPCSSRGVKGKKKAAL